MDLDSLKKRIYEIHDMGYIETHRSGNTGIGKTLEDLLNIQENNREDADLQDLGIEIKSARNQSDSMLTLFTKEPPRSEREFWYRDMIKEIGYIDDKGRRALKSTIYHEQPNNQGLYTDIDAKSIGIIHKDRGTCARYPIEVIEDKVKSRFPSLLMVDADRKRENGKEMFHYTDATLYEGFSFKEFRRLIEESKCVVELRMHMKENGGVRNRGTGWRLKSDKYLTDIFSDQKTIL